MSFADFLKQTQSFNAIRLVGPLFDPSLTSVDLSLPTIYIDGGLKFKIASPHLNFSLGDGDSSSHSPELLLNPDKDFSDLAYAMDSLPEHLNTIFLDGFLGGRRDHEWINFGVVYNFLLTRKSDSKAQVLFDGGKALGLSAASWDLTLNGGFSLLCFEDTVVKLEGEVKYPYLKAEKFPRLSSLGLSNTAQGQISLSVDRPVFLLKY